MKRQIPTVAVIAPALLIVAVVGYFLLVKPKQDESGRLVGEIAELQSKVDRALAAKHRADKDPETTIRVADLFKLTKAMPDKTDMPGIVLELDAVASSAGVAFASITPGQPAVKTGYTAIPINLMFQGNYYDLSDFLFRLRNLVVVRDGELGAEGRLFSLDSLSLQEGPTGLPLVQATLTVNAYVYTGGQPAAAPGAAPTPATTTTPTTTPTTSDTAQAGATG
jgi:Tfp pilus assembly protein PilO